jgi:NAD(P)-dependent dehydrogenase (short-subunit alcohol dehydrogenase family)
MQDLRGKVAVVTGGASGIGRAMAERFAAEGMAVVIGDIEEAAAKSAVAELEAGGAQALAMHVDVTDEDSVRALSDGARERFGTFHVICNNAGVAGHFGRAWDTPVADWRWVFDVNVWGVVHGIRAFVPTLVEQNEGHVVNTASLAAWAGVPGMSPYCATKHAVLAISESLRLELEASGSAVGVTAVCPGMINTNLMTGDRNWPLDRLGDRPAGPSDDVGQAIWTMLEQGVAAGVPPAEVADAVLDAILANQFIATSHPDDVAAAADRRRQIAAGGAPMLGGG